MTSALQFLSISSIISFAYFSLISLSIILLYKSFKKFTRSVLSFLFPLSVVLTSSGCGLFSCCDNCFSIKFCKLSSFSSKPLPRRFSFVGSLAFASDIPFSFDPSSFTISNFCGGKDERTSATA